MLWITTGQLGGSYNVILTYSWERALWLSFLESPVIAIYIILMAFCIAVVLLPAVTGLYIVGQMMLSDRICSGL